MNKKDFRDWMDNEGGFVALVQHGFDPAEIKSKKLREMVEEAIPAAETVIALEAFLYEQ